MGSASDDARAPHGDGHDGEPRGVRWLLGRDLPPEHYTLCRRVFSYWLAFVYLCAFTSLWVQIEGLAGSGGILPSHEWLARVHDALGDDAWHRVPTLLWLSSSDAALHAHCAAGVALSLAVLLGVWPRIAFALLWALYLSLAGGIDTFLNYQWDMLLLEAGLLAIFFAPRSHRGQACWSAPVSKSFLWLLRWLLFRLMFLSGFVKLASGDAAWRTLRALDFHYFTQPLPTWTSYWAHQLPHAIHAGSVLATFAIELGAPFLVFGPRRARYVACVAFAILQLSIAATGNYGFFNWLALGLCVPLLDDSLLARALPRRLRTRLAAASEAPPEPSPAAALALRRGTTAVCATAIAIVSFAGLDARLPLLTAGAFRPIAEVAAPLRSVNTYGLFSVMTTERPEIVVEGSRDGTTWEPYVFRWKPGPLDRRPRFAPFHMPRLDWQMWFAALGDCRRDVWFHRFALRLLEGAPAVTALLAHDPFADAPPRLLRSTVFHYEFTRPSGTGAWWRRRERGPYCPTVALEDGRLRAVTTP